ncbi:hypothetical protein O0L34_g1828 [Tuta absoluta]|nr:hypothetical protein O0L34_g1828 [Tuta absoluta]
MKEAYEQAAQDLQSKTDQQRQLESTVPSNEAKLNEVHSKLQTLKTQEANVAKEARALRAQLEESRQAMSANRSRGRVLDALMREKTNGNIPGIFGRLGDLGGIDQKYDVAVSTCCGALDNIVVDTVETAQACVAHLKRHDIGRATFIALDKQDHLRQYIEQRGRYPENVPRLFDLVKVRDDRVRPAFYYALRDTLVAQDLDQASRIAYGATRYRVVTLKGDVIEIAGTMSGGGKSTMRGRMSSSVQQDTSEQDPRVIQENERQLDTLEQRLTELRSEQVALEDQVVTLQRSTREGKTTLHKLNVELRSLTEQVPLLKNQIKQQQTRVSSCKVDPRQKAALEKALKTAQEKLDKAKHDAGEVEKEVHGVDAQISAVAGGRVKDLQKMVEDLSKKIDKVSTEITKLRVAINTSIRNAKKSKDKISQMETDLRETERALTNLTNQKKELTLETQRLQKEIEELDEQISEGSGEFTDLKKEIAALQKKENEIKSERLEANNAVEKSAKKISEANGNIRTWEHNIKDLKLEDPGIDGVPGIDRPEPLDVYTPEQLEEVSVDELRNRLQAQKARVGDAKPNVQAILSHNDDCTTVDELRNRLQAQKARVGDAKPNVQAILVRLSYSSDNVVTRFDSCQSHNDDCTTVNEMRNRLQAQKARVGDAKPNVQAILVRLSYSSDNVATRFDSCQSNNNDCTTVDELRNRLQAQKARVGDAKPNVQAILVRLSYSSANVATRFDSCQSNNNDCTTVDELRNRLQAQKTRVGDAKPNVQAILVRLSYSSANVVTLFDSCQSHNNDCTTVDELRNRLQAQKTRVGDAKPNVQAILVRLSYSSANVVTLFDSCQSHNNDCRTVDELRNRLQAQKARVGDAKPNVQAILAQKARVGDAKPNVQAILVRLGYSSANVVTLFDSCHSHNNDSTTVDELRNRLQAQKARVGVAKPNVQAILVRLGYSSANVVTLFDSCQSHNNDCTTVDELRNRLQAQKARVGVAKPNVQAILVRLGYSSANVVTLFDSCQSHNNDCTTVDELRNRLQAQKARVGDAKPNVQAILAQKARVGDAKPNVQAILVRLGYSSANVVTLFDSCHSHNNDSTTVDELRNRLQAQKARVGVAKPNVQAILVRLGYSSANVVTLFDSCQSHNNDCTTVDELRNRLQAQKARVGDAKPNVQAILCHQW